MRISGQKGRANTKLKRLRNKIYVRQSLQNSRRKTASIKRLHLKPSIDVSRPLWYMGGLEMDDQNNTREGLIPTLVGVALRRDPSRESPTFFDILRSRVFTFRGVI